MQLSLLKSLGLPFPAARVIHHASQAPAAADGLRFPVVVKPNIGGSGAGIVRFDSPGGSGSARRTQRTLDLGIDQTALVQEFIPARDGRIVRVEVLGGRYLYAINVYSTGESFNLCPADVCQTIDGAELDRAACAGGRAEERPARRELHAAGRDHRRRRAHHGRGGHRGRRRRVHRRRPRRAAATSTTSTRSRTSSPTRRASSASIRSRGWPTSSKREAALMRFGYWLPVFGGWLRNVDDERMAPTWDYVSRWRSAARSRARPHARRRAEPQRHQGRRRAVARRLDHGRGARGGHLTLEIMVAVRPTFHEPALLAKQAANIDHISGGRLSLNVVSSWWAEEAKQYGVQFDQHDERYARTAEWLEVVDGLWREPLFSLRRAASTTSRTPCSSRSRCAGRGRRSTPAASRQAAKDLIAAPATPT